VKQYLLSIYQPDDTAPPDDLDQIMSDLAELNTEMRKAGAWVFAAGLHAPDTATVAKAFSEWKKDPRIKKVQQLSEGPRGARFHVAYASPHSIYVHILQHTPVALGAIRFSQGVEHYQITGESEALQDLLKVLGDKGKVEVLSIREAHEVEAEEAQPSPTTGLTDKQIEALVLAHQEGYYQWAVEHTDDPHPRNAYWEMWNLPLFDLRPDQADVALREVKACREQFPGSYVKVIAYDATYMRQTTALAFIVGRPADEPRFRVERTDGHDRTMRYGLRYA